MTEVMLVVRRFGGRGDGNQGQDGRHEIDDRLERIREQPDGAGEQEGKGLHADRDYRRPDGQPCPLRQRVGVSSGHYVSIP